jgi:hypothetical protein
LKIVDSPAEVVPLTQAARAGASGQTSGDAPAASAAGAEMGELEPISLERRGIDKNDLDVPAFLRRRIAD